jgi:phosphoribosylformylglycinamidine cyclo-ligase
MQAMPVKGLAHITGGGLLDNVPRILQPGLKAVLDSKSWTLPPLFQWLQREGNVADAEMHRVFNCGIGMVLVLSPENEKPAAELLSAAGEHVFLIGRIEECAAGEAQTVVV